MTAVTVVWRLPAKKFTIKSRPVRKILCRVGEDVSAKYGIPIINKRISVTPISLVAESCEADSYVEIAKTLDRAAKATGVNFIGGFSALVQKGFTKGDEKLIRSTLKVWQKRTLSARQSMLPAPKAVL